MITAYRVFRKDKHGMPATLFHGIAGSKSLSLDQLLIAENRMIAKEDWVGSDSYSTYQAA